MIRFRAVSFNLLIACLFSTGVLCAQQTSNGATNPPAASTVPDKLPPTIYGDENLHSLAISDSNMHAATPIVGDKAEYPEFTRELLQVQWRPGDPIDLYIIKPRNVVEASGCYLSL